MSVGDADVKSKRRQKSRERGVGRLVPEGRARQLVGYVASLGLDRYRDGEVGIVWNARKEWGVDPENGSRGRWRRREQRENEGEEARNQCSAAITVDRTSALTVVFCIYAEAQTGLEDMNVEGERKR
ncbi:hypothetical protein B0H13DRAFT_1872912 [Mycena leptocephala]|nr:hypothetical protein B0H13DRAFT_1872912 [Mycena leptocephala]